MQIPFPLVFSLTLLAKWTQGAHIVFIHQMASYSHIVTTKPLADALVQRGHNVTYISGVRSPPTSPNMTHIVPEHLANFLSVVIEESYDISTRLEGRMPNYLAVLEEMNLIFCQALLQSPEFQFWLKSTENVDLIFIDNFPGPECGMGIAQKLDSKIAVFLPHTLTTKYMDMLGVPLESSSIPVWTQVMKTPMTFLSRVKNTLEALGFRFNQIIKTGAMELLLKQYLEISDFPPVGDTLRNISLVLMNGHFLEEHRRPLPPIFVSIPGLHISENPPPLSKEIQDFVDSKSQDGDPSEGFVYISFGTVAKASKLPLSIREIYFNSIRAFPKVRFLWKWDGDIPEDKPENLYLSNWFNQQSLLASSKIQGFVTQAGRPSSQEALYNGVPVVTFPILGDQDYNSEMLEDLGVSINLEIGDVTEEDLIKALSTILYDKRMKERCLEVSKVYKDLPMKPVESGVWWTEYVLRHNDTSHLIPLVVTQTWYQRRLLDVWAFIAISIPLFIFVTFRGFGFIFWTTKKLKQM